MMAKGEELYAYQFSLRGMSPEKLPRPPSPWHGVLGELPALASTGTPCMRATSRNFATVFLAAKKILLGSGWMGNPQFCHQIADTDSCVFKTKNFPKLCEVSFLSCPQVSLGFWLWLCWSLARLLPEATAFHLKIRPSALALEFPISKLLWLLQFTV